MVFKTYDKIVNNSDISATLNPETSHKILNFLIKANSCIGNCDYHEMIDKRIPFGNYQEFKKLKR